MYFLHYRLPWENSIREGNIASCRWDLQWRTKDNDSILTRPVAEKSKVETMEPAGKLSYHCSKLQLKASNFPFFFSFFFKSVAEEQHSVGIIFYVLEAARRRSVVRQIGICCWRIPKDIQKNQHAAHCTEHLCQMELLSLSGLLSIWQVW